MGQQRLGTVPASRVASHVSNERFRGATVKLALPLSTCVGFENLSIPDQPSFFGKAGRAEAQRLHAATN